MSDFLRKHIENIVRLSDEEYEEIRVLSVQEVQKKTISDSGKPKGRRIIYCEIGIVKMWYD